MAAADGPGSAGDCRSVPRLDLGALTLSAFLAALQHMVSRAQDWGFRRVACGKFVRRREPRSTPSTRAPCGSRSRKSIALRLVLAHPCAPGRARFWKWQPSAWLGRWASFGLYKG